MEFRLLNYKNKLKSLIESTALNRTVKEEEKKSPIQIPNINLSGLTLVNIKEALTKNAFILLCTYIEYMDLTITKYKGHPYKFSP